MDRVKSNWVYRKLRNFRAGIESDISCLKANAAMRMIVRRDSGESYRAMLSDGAGERD
jgi:hypothetical protein